MRRRLLIATLLLGCFGIGFAAVIADLSGKWTGKITTPDGNELQINYVFKVDGDKLTGTAQGDGSPSGLETLNVKSCLLYTSRAGMNKCR